MGKKFRERPERLAEKLKQIRDGLGLSQSELIQRMGLTDYLLREEISDFKRGRRARPYRFCWNTRVSPASIWTLWWTINWIYRYGSYARPSMKALGAAPREKPLKGD
jgi:hypothetical protein